MNNIVVISDTHFGCQFGLCPSKFRLDGGGYYQSSDLQKKVYKMWSLFHSRYVPIFTKGEPYILVHVGDCVDGVHHRSTSQITHNLKDQVNLAYEVLAPIREKAQRYFHIRGTAAHIGPSGELEEEVAKLLDAEPDEIGNYARWDLWINMNKNLIHFSHHIAHTTSSSYESTGVYKEAHEATIAAGKTGRRPPNMIIRGHRHRFFKTDDGGILVVVCPGWQLKTPYTYRLPNARASSPQFGGLVIRSGHEDPIYIRRKIWDIERPKEVVI